MSRIIRSTKFWLVGAVVAASLAGTAYATIPGRRRRHPRLLRQVRRHPARHRRLGDELQVGRDGAQLEPAWPTRPQGRPGRAGARRTRRPAVRARSPGRALRLRDRHRVYGGLERPKPVQQGGCPAGKVALAGGANLFEPLGAGLPPELALDLSSVAPDDGGLAGWIAAAHEVVPTGVSR